MEQTLEARCRALLVELELCRADEKMLAEPLTGGVASDIAKVGLNDRKFCVKFALPKLKVAEDWFAPVHRNATEYAWLQAAASVAPESAVRLFGRSNGLHGFVMEYLEGDDVYLWKSNLLSEAPDRNEAAQVGHLIGRVHAESAKSGFDTADFQNRDDFYALRIEPYIAFTASRHHNLSAILNQIADDLYASSQVLVHGDVSPKNILFRKSGPVVLDAECATMGDASFDPSFCMNQLVLKAIHLPTSRERYLANALDFWSGYSPHISWEKSSELESRICRLLPVLMLGRVDGKSPVEYLSGPEQEIVRKVASRFVEAPKQQLGALVEGIGHMLQEINA